MPRPTRADERTTMTAFLRWHRLTFEVKCAGLSAAELARRSAGRSTLSLLGLIRHHAEGERFWFRQVMAAENPPPLFAGDGDVAFAVTGDPHLVAQAWQMWREEVAFAERFVATASDLDVVGDEPGAGPVSLRWVLLHMIEEYARHNGHADLLREHIDGRTGL
nr:DinB family protein [Hamadaea flava]